MHTVHVFSSVGRFGSAEELRNFVEMTYSEDGDGVPSPFMREVRLRGYEPACIECSHSDRVRPVRDLVAGASWAGQWRDRIDATKVADAAVCVFGPNEVGDPASSSLEHCGSFTYVP